MAIEQSVNLNQNPYATGGAAYSGSVGGAVGGLFSGIGKLWNRLTGKDEQNKWANQQWQNEANFSAQQATLSYERQRQLIAEQRAYESPLAQMQRFVDAGLNPDLIYGQLNPQMMANNPDMASTPHGGFASGVNAPVADILSVARTAAEIKRMNTQNYNETKMTDKQIERWAKENGVSDAQAKLYLQNASESAERTRNYAKEWILMDKEEQLKNYEIQIKKDTWQDTVNQLKDVAKITHDEAQYSLLYFQARYDYIVAGRDDLLASKTLKEAQAKLTDKQREYFEATMNDLIDIVANQKTQSDLAVAMTKFIKGHQNNWEYWLNKGINILALGVQALGAVRGMPTGSVPMYNMGNTNSTGF